MGGSKTAILAQGVYFYFGAVDYITIGGNIYGLPLILGDGFPTHRSQYQHAPLPH